MITRSLVPAQKTKAMFGNRVNVHTPEFNLLSLEGRPIVHSVSTGLTEPARSAGLVRWFEDHALKVIAKTPDNSAGADVIVITRPVNGERSEAAAEYERVWGNAKEGTVFIHPLSNKLLTGFNFTHFMDTRSMDLKTMAVQQCKSQTYRIKFDQVQKDASRANALYAKKDASGPFEYAELFKMALVGPDGSVTCYPLSSVDDLPQTGDAICISPHLDDFAIGFGGAGNSLSRRGWSVLDAVLTTSTRGVTDEFVHMNCADLIRNFPDEAKELAFRTMLLKEGLRFQETAFADALLGAKCRTFGFDFWERIGRDGMLEVHQEEIYAAQMMIEALVEGAPDLIAMPLEGDEHLAHIATYLMGNEITRVLADKYNKNILTAGYASPWFNGGIPVNAYLYWNPGMEYTQDNPAAFYAGRALAEAARELVMGPGANPPEMRAYCEGDSPIAEGYYIAVKE